MSAGTLRPTNNLRRARLAAGFSQEGFATRIGVTRQTLWNYETGRSPIPPDKAPMMAALLEVEPAYLVGWTADPGEFRELARGKAA